MSNTKSRRALRSTSDDAIAPLTAQFSIAAPYENLTPSSRNKVFKPLQVFSKLVGKLTNVAILRP